MRKNILPSVLSFLLIGLLLISSVPQSLTAEAADTELKLVISASPPSVSADEGIHRMLVIQTLTKDDTPKPVTENLRVSLSSSKVSIGSTDLTVSIPEGSAFTVADFYTTKTAGSTIVTASAPGYATASTTITTVLPANTPSTLRVYVAPNITMAEQGSTSDVIVQLADSRGIPAVTDHDLQVALTLSDENVGTVDKSVTVTAGKSSARTTFYAGLTSGSTTITASAPEYPQSTAGITVTGFPASEFKLFATPIRVAVGEAGTLTVQLRTSSGLPARAAVRIPVSLYSSNNTIVRVQPSVTIEAGESYGVATFSTLSSTGSAIITAITTGASVSTTTARTTVFVQEASEKAEKLQVYVTPDSFLAYPDTHNSIVVQRVDNTGKPAKTPSSLDVVLSSSAPKIGEVTSITIPAGQTYGIASFTTTYAAGDTWITVGAPNLVTPEPLKVSTIGNTPSKITVDIIPSTQAVDGGTQRAVVVGFRASNNQPAKVTEDLTVLLSSSKTDVGAVQQSIVITQGYAYAVADFYPANLPGQTVITASAASLTSGSAIITTAEPHPTKLSLFAIPKLMLTGQTLDSAIAVQLQDSNGIPVNPKEPVIVSLSTSNPDVGNVPASVTIPTDQSFARVDFQATYNPGKTTITASAAGFATSSADVTTFSFPMDIVLTSTATRLKKGDSAEITVQVTSGGTPTAGALIHWVSSQGTFKYNDQVADQNGRATNVVTITSEGPIVVYATAGKAGFGSPQAQISLQEYVPLISDYILYIIGIAIALIPVIGIIAWVISNRRKKSKVQAVNLRPIIEGIDTRNWQAKQMGMVKGRSGLMHQFSLVVYNLQNSPEVIVDVNRAPGEIEEEAILSYFAKVSDTGIKKAVLGIVPALSEKAMNLAKFYNIKVIEAPTEDIIVKELSREIHGLLGDTEIVPSVSKESEKKEESKSTDKTNEKNGE